MAQLRSLGLFRWLRARDPLALVPSWWFFGDNPGSSELNLEIARQGPGGGWSPWTPLEIPPRGLLGGLWNPGRRARQALSDAAAELAGAVSEQGVSIEHTPAFRALSALTLTCNPGGTASRFRLVLVGAGESRVLFVSHPLSLEESWR